MQAAKVIQTAKVFQSGNSQAVRLPKTFRFAQQEVEILRRGDEVVLRPIANDLVAALEALPELPQDCFAEGRLPQGSLEARDWDGV